MDAMAIYENIRAQSRRAARTWGGALPWKGYDFYGFRHSRPPDLSMYQAQVTANFSYVDGHVETANANVPDQNRYERIAFKP